MQKFKLLLLLFLFPLLLFGQQKYTISGYIEDNVSGERLISASIIDPIAGNGTLSNTYGFFSFSFDVTENTEGVVVVSYIGYQSQKIRFSLKKDTSLIIKLKTSQELDVLEVNAKKQNRIEEQVQMSQITVPLEQIKRMPMILGEADVLKTLQFLPGVKSGSEGTAGINVRGGSPDQNLYLLDGVPVYNPTHIGGLFSIFNADALKNVSIMKGGFPARFGGRLSSVIEVDTKDGNKQAFHSNVSVGLLSTRVLLEGPILKNRLSYMISARRTYLDVALRNVLNTKEVIGSTIIDSKRMIYFYDFNGKFNWRLGNKHNLFLSLYQGFDVFYTNQKETYLKGVDNSTNGFDFKNRIASLRWNWQISNQLFANTTAYYTQYTLNFKDFKDRQFDTFPRRKENILFSTGIKDYAVKTDFDYNFDKNNRLKFGLSLIRHEFLPNRLSVQSTGQRDTILGGKSENALESDAYIEDEWHWQKLKANVGVRLSAFQSKNRAFVSLQPRANLSYALPLNAALKLSYSRSTQFIHTLVNDALGFPTDSWVPSVIGVKPALAEQIALGWVKSLGNNYEFSVETYYKTMNNLVAYREGSSFLNVDPVWERNVVQGSGKAYGLEFFVQKKEGKLTGWVSYTLSKATRLFTDINDGKTYRFKYDRRHELAIVANYRLKKNISLSANWTFATGNPITLPRSVYNLPIEQFPNIDILTIIDYGARNSFQTQAIHRLDVGVEFYKKRKKYERRWNLGLYNAYNRGNPFYLYFTTSSGGEPVEPLRNFKIYNVRQYNLLPILPAISYEIKF